MAATSRFRLQAVHSFTTTPSKVSINNDGGLKGQQKKYLVKVSRLSAAELADVAPKYQADIGWIDALRSAVAGGDAKLDRSVAGFSKMNSGFLIAVTSAVLRRRESIVSSSQNVVESVESLIRRASRGRKFKSGAEALAWAAANGVDKAKIGKLVALAQTYEVTLRARELTELPRALATVQQQVKMSVANVATILRSEPAGYLHLEKLEFTPTATQRGELVHSVPLAPREEVSITQREWSHNSEEFERIITDQLEEYSEKGVTEKSELAQSSANQEQHSLAFNTGLSVTGTYGAVTATATANLAIGSSSSESATESRNKSYELTQKASSRSKKDHKITFRIASEAEKERTQVQKIVNPSSSRAARVDYYQMIRSWDVRLFRYGVRLTWDIVVPEPACDLLARMEELADIKRKMAMPFEEYFTVVPNDLTASTYLDTAAEYAATVSTIPPAAATTVAVADNKDWSSTPNGYTTSYTIDTVIPDGLEVSGNASFNYFVDHKSGTWGIIIDDISSHPRNRIYSDGSSWGAANVPAITTWIGKSGVLKLFVLAWDIKHFAVAVQVPCAPKPETWAAWRAKTWSEIRAGAQAQYYERRQMLKTRMEELEDELSLEDALSLRKREREEVMKGVLRWLGIEGHEFYPSAAPEDVGGDEGLFNPTTGLLWTNALRNKFVAHGDKVRFIHQAVEWENVLYFLYPYFWVHPRRWQEKLYLHHPDSIHRSFLKAGSCRVVLTIRPGFESAFLAFINSGDMNSLPPSPYLEIGQELKAYATANYQGIPPANPVQNYRPLLTWRQRRAWDELQALIVLLERFRAARSRYPTQAEGSVALAAYTDAAIPAVPAADPWGTAYVYTIPGDHSEYDLYTGGSGIANDPTGENVPITNWAEASLVGNWTEYTPTSALDVAFTLL